MERESAEFKARESEAAKPLAQQDTEILMNLAVHTSPNLETVGQVTNAEGPGNPLRDSNANHLSTHLVEDAVEPLATPNEPKDHVDDGGEVVVEGEEDTVIY